MAKAQPIRALANYLEYVFERDGLNFLDFDKDRGKNIAFLNAQYLPDTILIYQNFAKN
jgi:hypothetical protein